MATRTVFAQVLPNPETSHIQIDIGKPLDGAVPAEVGTGTNERAQAAPGSTGLGALRGVREVRIDMRQLPICVNRHGRRDDHQPGCVLIVLAEIALWRWDLIRERIMDATIFCAAAQPLRFGRELQPLAA